jgi:hypothetical protein
MDLKMGVSTEYDLTHDLHNARERFKYLQQ